MPAVLLFFDISAGELMIILLIAFLVFGPSKIPEIARKIGKGMNEIRRASDEIKREIAKETRTVEKEMKVETPVFNDMKKTAEEIRQEFDHITDPEKEAGKGPDAVPENGAAPTDKLE